jgi:colanic acid/amylovoran biosynthesis glycosyltransferase
MKIAFIMNSFPTLSETFILNQITGLIDRGHEVYIFAYKNKKESKIHNEVKKYNLLDKVYYFNIPKNKFHRIIKAFYLLSKYFPKNPKIIKSLNFIKYKENSLNLKLFYIGIKFINSNKKFDIVHCHYGVNGNIGVTLKEIGIIKSKIITSFYGFDVSRATKYKKQLYQKLFQKGDLFISLSNFMKKQQLNKLGAPDKKIIIHHLGVDLEKFKLEKKHNLKKTIRLLTIARLTEKKGLAYSIKAFQKLHKNYPNIEYNIIGNGPLKTKLEKIIEELNLKNKVNLLGEMNKNQIKKILENSDIFILTSVTASDGDMEGTPTVILEAMSAELPILSTWHAGIPEQIKNYETGLLVTEKDIPDISQKLSYLIENPKISYKMGKNGRMYVKKYYNIKKLNDELVKIYQSVLKNKEGTIAKKIYKI